MENTLPTRPATLTRLCVLSFINQGPMFLLYLLGIPAAWFMRNMDPEELRSTTATLYGSMLRKEQIDAMAGFFDILQEHGVALMSVLALRTLARAIGTWRMWDLRKDGFHIYTTAQLLGILLPMLIAGNSMFNILGLMAAVLWSYMYWTQRKALVR